MSSRVAQQATLGRARVVGAVAALVAAALYLLIGLGVLSIGTGKSGEAPDLFAFGATLAGIFAVVAALLLRFPSRLTWLAVAVVQLIVLVGYFAMADIRTPSIELWGLLIKACQLVVLAAVASLLVRAHADAVR